MGLSKVLSYAGWAYQRERWSSQLRKFTSGEKFLRTDAECITTQQEAFKCLGWDFERALARLSSILLEAGVQSFDVMSDSQHWMVFAALADTSFNPKKIVEIGTFDGGCALLLSRLFPLAEVFTLDLPDDSQQVRQSYGRHCGKMFEAFLERRAENLSTPNITFVQQNSFYLPDMGLRDVDLIWLDGDHTFPALAWDFCNAFHVMRDGGVLVCDDVIRYPEHSISPRAHSRIILDYLSRERIYSVDYVLKRIACVHAADPWHRKYLGVLRK